MDENGTRLGKVSPSAGTPPEINISGELFKVAFVRRCKTCSRDATTLLGRRFLGTVLRLFHFLSPVFIHRRKEGRKLVGRGDNLAEEERRERTRIGGFVVAERTGGGLDSN